MNKYTVKLKLETIASPEAQALALDQLEQISSSQLSFLSTHVQDNAQELSDNFAVHKEGKLVVFLASDLTDEVKSNYLLITPSIIEAIKGVNAEAEDIWARQLQKLSAVNGQAA